MPATTTAGYNTARADGYLRFDVRVDKRAVWRDWLLDFYIAEGATGAYFATCVDYSAQGAESGVDLIAARDAAITNTGGNLFTSEDILVQGRNAIEFTAAFSTSEVDGLMLGRVVADGTALCQVWAIDIADTISDASFEFVESFQFVEEL